jgi:Tfp pilus assembly protein PilZ
VDRRKTQRRVRRIPVRFWKQGEQEPRNGYMTNVSATGIFVNTNHPLPGGTRIRVEVLDPQLGFVVEGRVAHAMKVAPALQQVRPSGMGIRFVPLEELVGALFRASGAAAPDHEAAAPMAEGPPRDGVYPLRFATAHEFLDTFRREVQWGGVFVATDFPAEMNAPVTIEIHSPGDGGEPVRLPARVVKTNAAGPPQGDGDGEGRDEGAPPGMGVVFTDLEAAIEVLRPVALRLS